MQYFLRNSSHLTYYKITACVEQEGTEVFLKELITFTILQNYYMCRTRGNCSIFKGIYQDHTTTKILLMQDWRKKQNFCRNFKTSANILVIQNYYKSRMFRKVIKYFRIL